MKEHLTWPPVLLMLFAATLLTALLSWFVVGRGMAEFQTRIELRASQLAEEQRKAGILGAITALAAIDADMRATAQGRAAPDNPAVQAKMGAIFERFALDNMIVMAADGTVNAYKVKNVRTTITGKNFAWRPYFSGAIAGNPTMYAAFGSNSHERGFYISTPIPASANDATPVGVIVAKLGFDEIDQQLAREAAPLMVLSPEGVVFASNVDAWRYQVLGGAPELALAKSEKRVNNAYKETAPQLIALGPDGAIERAGHRLVLHTAPIAWPDPSGTWRIAGFIRGEDIFGWPARGAVWIGIFLVLMLTHTWLQARQRARRRTEQVVSLLNNSGEGFLSFGRDLRIDEEYSRACEHMLSTPPARQEVASLLFEHDAASAALLREIITSALDERDTDVRDCMLSLLPREIRRGDTLLAVEYRLIGPEKFMVILTDVTEERRMAEQLELEQRHLRMVVLAVSDSRGFFEAMDGFREFLAHWRKVLLPSVTDAEGNALRVVYREIHTFKGLLNQFSFPTTPLRLHEAESCLSALLDATSAGGEEGSLGDPVACIEAAGLDAAFADDLAVLTDALGAHFLAQGRTLVLTEAQARQLEALSLELLDGKPVDTGVAAVHQLLEEILRLRKVRFADALNGYTHMVAQVAQRVEKQVAPLHIDDDTDVWVDPERYKPFLQTLTHVFRNAVIHGLESPEVRWEHGKDETGRIHCRVRIENDCIRLSISDDGAGLDLAALREKATLQGHPDAAALNDHDAAALIFMDGITTHTTANDLAGRGVGLAAVRAETEKLGGTVSVHSDAGLGTTFVFTLPVNPPETPQKNPQGDFPHECHE